MTRARGFTLIELVVGASVALTVIAAAGATLVHVNRLRLLSVTRAELERDVALATGWLRRDVYAAGMGMRAGGLRQAGGAQVAGSALSPPVRGISAAGFELYAELPRPDSNFDGLSNLGDASTTATAALANELSGRCPDQAACLAAPGFLVGSVFPNAAACDDISSPNTALACPWGLRKLVTAGANNATVVFPDGHYENTTVRAFTAPAGGPLQAALVPALSAPPSRPLASGVMLQVDKVGYRIITPLSGRTVLQRRHCWGAPQPELGTFANCAANSNDTGWQTIARDVAGSEFRFYAADGITPAAADADVRSLEIRLVLSRLADLSGSTASGRTVKIDVTERFAPGTPVR